MNDYERIAQIIRYLDTHRAEQPQLNDLARHVALSPFHFHRLFSAWAGVTPKDFLQCLTVAHARKLLREGASVLEASLDAGLSGPGRLHDACVTLEAASPGELKNGGRGWSIVFGFADSPFGECVIGEGPRGICYLAFTDEHRRAEGVEALRQSWPAAKLRRNDTAAAQSAGAIFRRPGTRTLPDPQRLRAYVQGSAFQVKVWNALLRVPPGSLVTYGSLAVAVGQASAARAVGSAVGSNPLAYLIPCHRVIRQTGIFGEYRWGEMRKRALIAWETSRYTGNGPLAIYVTERS